MAAAAAANGISLSKDGQSLDAQSRNAMVNGTGISSPFTNLGPTDTHTTDVGTAAPRVSTVLSIGIPIPYLCLLTAL